MKITQKHLQFLAQKKYPSLASKVNNGAKVSIHELIPNSNQAYKREVECEVTNTLMLLKSWRKKYTNDELYHKLADVTHTLRISNWRDRLFSKLMNSLHTSWVRQNEHKNPYISLNGDKKCQK